MATKPRTPAAPPAELERPAPGTVVSFDGGLKGVVDGAGHLVCLDCRRHELEPKGFSVGTLAIAVLGGLLAGIAIGAGVALLEEEAARGTA